ncbi:hypothetical protein [Sphingomonas sp.]|uniref:hypothetical protein n=1 Tax=Sphingomonas sp. TaxID=28214 RepID=UPI001B0E4821|nr:hypothetical protein [Sphingomonas sp.]MBO9711556.1 hypothetical protein [Sphingomonas sp.]
MRDIFARIFTLAAAVFAWMCTLAAGFAIFMAVAILALLPIEAARNRAAHALAEQFAQSLAATHAEPSAADPDHEPTTNIKGFHMWAFAPGGCDGVGVEAPSDRFAVGFWDNGSDDPFDVTWWYCYAYPSGKTTLQLSVWDFLKGAAGSQIAWYALIAAIAAIAGYCARSLGARDKPRSLQPWSKAVWFGALMTFLNLLYVVADREDDQFYESSETLKWIVVVFDHTLYLAERPMIFVLQNAPGFAGVGSYLLVTFVAWSVTGWVAGLLISFGRARLRTV